MLRIVLRLAVIAFTSNLLGTAPCMAQEKLANREAKQIAEEAYIYGFPMVMGYGVMYEYAVDTKSDQYKAPFNKIYNMARVITPKDTAVVTPNSDTPYSFVWADLRAEPLVLSVPKVEKGRYYSVQLVDLYTFNYGYIGSRATGNDAGSYMIAGPSWKGETPKGVKKVFRCETEFSLVLYAINWGMKSGLEKIKEKAATLSKKENGWQKVSAFGDRSFYKGDWTLRAAAAMAGIFGNDPVEALYPLLVTDSEGNKPDCSKNRYTLTFPKGQLPPVNAFWSVTMYDGKTQLLIENPINRYLINSPMLPDLKLNDDGSLTIYLQKDSPEKDKESNCLPAPDGPIYLAMRLYWPKEEALKGEWNPPAVKRVK